MTARFKRHIKSRSGGISPAIGKSIDFRMGPAIKFVPSFTDDFAVFYKYRAHHRIRTGMSHPVSRQLQRPRHKLFVIINPHKKPPVFREALTKSEKQSSPIQTVLSALESHQISHTARGLRKTFTTGRESHPALKIHNWKHTD